MRKKSSQALIQLQVHHRWGHQKTTGPLTLPPLTTPLMETHAVQNITSTKLAQFSV